MSFIFWSMPYQLFQILGERGRQVVAQNIGLLTGLIDTSQKEEWIEFLSGGIPSQILTWRGSLQEAYYLFNQIRIKTLAGESLVNIHTKNRGLDWVKINKVISTRYGNIQKESRPKCEHVISSEIVRFIQSNNKSTLFFPGSLERD
jgi:hypothetical protein